MKKVFMFPALAAVLLAGTSCNQEGGLSDNGTQSQDLIFKVASSGDGLTTRSNRTLYSSEATQEIDRLRLYVIATNGTQTGNVVFTREIDWTASQEYGVTGEDHGKQITFTFRGEDKLEEGTYRVVAVGFDTKDGLTYAPNVRAGEADTLAVGEAYSDIVATTAANASEVFAGELAELVAEENLETGAVTFTGSTEVVLHRQVAGSLGYFMNVPASVDGQQAEALRMVVRTKNQSVTFTDFNSAFRTTGEDVKYVVNGSNPFTHDGTTSFQDGSEGFELYRINFSDWFTPDASGAYDTNSDGWLTKEDNWNHDTTAVKASVVKGSMLAGTFVNPIAFTTGLNTMELQLLDDNDKILKIWTVQIPDPNTTVDDDPNVVDESEYVFNIYRNHMYNIGVKAETGDPSDPDPEDPTDPEDPEDLSKAQDIVLKVNDNWETIHQLVLE